MSESVLSIGHIYSIFTYLLGFTPNSDEGKVEALAALSKRECLIPLYVDLMDNTLIKDGIIDFKDNIDLIFSDNYLDNLLDNYRKEEIAKAIQVYLEDVASSYFKSTFEITKEKNLILCGGVTANVIMNKRIFEELTENIFIFPAMGDDVELLLWRQMN